MAPQAKFFQNLAEKYSIWRLRWHQNRKNLPSPSATAKFLGALVGAKILVGGIMILFWLVGGIAPLAPRHVRPCFHPYFATFDSKLCSKNFIATTIATIL